MIDYTEWIGKTVKFSDNFYGTEFWVYGRVGVAFDRNQDIDFRVYPFKLEYKLNNEEFEGTGKFYEPYSMKYERDYTLT